MEDWRSLEKLQKIMLLVVAAMFVLFTILYPALNAREGIAYGNTLLIRSQAGENAVYTGQIRERKAAFTVSPGGVVSCMWDGAEGETYTVIPDETAAPEDSFWPERGIEIRRGDEVVFRGDWGPIIYANDIALRGGTYSDDMRLAVLLTQSPVLTSRGVWELYWGGIVLSILAVLDLFFSGVLFRVRMAFHVKDPYGVEPSEWEMFSRRLSWVVFPAIAFICYLMGCIQIR